MNPSLFSTLPNFSPTRPLFLHKFIPARFISSNFFSSGLPLLLSSSHLHLHFGWNVVPAKTPGFHTSSIRKERVMRGGGPLKRTEASFFLGQSSISCWVVVNEKPFWLDFLQEELVRWLDGWIMHFRLIFNFSFSKRETRCRVDYKINKGEKEVKYVRVTLLLIWAGFGSEFQIEFEILTFFH